MLLDRDMVSISDIGGSGGRPPGSWTDLVGKGTDAVKDCEEDEVAADVDRSEGTEQSSDLSHNLSDQIDTLTSLGSIYCPRCLRLAEGMQARYG